MVMNMTYGIGQLLGRDSAEIGRTTQLPGTAGIPAPDISGDARRLPPGKHHKLARMEIDPVPGESASATIGYERTGDGWARSALRRSSFAPGGGGSNE